MTTVDEARALRDAEGLRMKIFEPHDSVTDTVVVTKGDTGGYRVWTTNERATPFGTTTVHDSESDALDDGLERARAGRDYDDLVAAQHAAYVADMRARGADQPFSGPRGSMVDPVFTGPHRLTEFAVYSSSATSDRGRYTDHVGSIHGRPGEGWRAITREARLAVYDTIDEAVEALLDATGN
jgi:hypothetical protein